MLYWFLLVLFLFIFYLFFVSLSHHVSWSHPSPPPPQNKSKENLREKEGKMKGLLFFCELSLYPPTLLKLSAAGHPQWNFWFHLCRVSCHLQGKILWLLPSKVDPLGISVLVRTSSIIYKCGKSGHFVLYMILVELLWIYLHLICCWL